MPRNAAGFYTLPLPPVEPNTVIEADWANTTMDDLAEAVTNSLSRFGQGGMAAPFRIVDGTAANPSLSFVTEPSSGLFKQSSGVVGMSVQGVVRQTWNTNGTSFIGSDVGLGGVVTFPSTGLWLSGGTSQTGVSIGTKGPPVAALEVNYNVPAGPVSILVGNSASGTGGGMSAAQASGTNPAFLANSLFISPGSLNSPLWLGTLNGPTSYIGFMVNSVDKMRIDANGNVGLGMLYTTPAVAGETGVDFGSTSKSWLNFYVGGVRKAFFAATGSSTAIGTHDAQPLYLLTANAGRLIIQPTGFVGIGPTAPIALAPLHVRSSTELMRLESTQARGGGNAYMSFFDPSGRKGYVGYGSGGIDDNFFIVNELVSPMLFFNNQSERMRIEATGRVGINGAAPGAQLTVNWVGPGQNGLAVVGTLAGDVSSCYLSQRVDNSGATMTMRLNVTVAGSITHPTLTTTAYNTSSDARLKRNIRPVKDVGKIIDNIPVVSFDWKTDGVHVPVGLIAQDVHGVFPQAVHEGGSDAHEDPWQMDNAKLVPLLVRELQCLRERVNVLESECR
jgi:hypothetical protein